MKKIFILSLLVFAYMGCTKKMTYNPAVTPAVLTMNPTNVTASSAELVAQAPDGGAALTERGFYWLYKSPDMISKDGSVDFAIAEKLLAKQGVKVKASLQGDFTATITNLQKDTAILVRAYATNSIGTTYGQSILFRSSKEVPPTVQIDQQYTNLGDTALLVSGSITAVGGSNVSERGFIWGTNENVLLNTQKKTLGTGQGSFSYTIPALQQFVKYYIVSYATNSFGAVYSNPLVVIFVPPTFTDTRDGEVYTVKQYGGIIWMTQNYRYLPAIGNAAGIWVQGYAGNNIQEAKATQAYKTYGVLYNLTQATNLAPAGWHLATDEEWKKLEIISTNGALTPAAANASDWRAANADRLKAWGGASNDMGFNLLPGGRQWCGGAFQDADTWAHYWAAKEGHPYNTFFRRMLAGWDSRIYRADSDVDGTPVCVGMSARYVKDY